MLTAVFELLILASTAACPVPMPRCEDPRPVGSRDPQMLYPCLVDGTVRRQYEEKARAGVGQHDVRLWKYYLEDQKNEGEAMQWLNMAATRDHPDSQYTFGAILFRRAGDSGSCDEALAWMTRAAEASGEFAGFLGNFYRDTLKNRTDALRWFQRGAQLGSEAALEHAIALMVKMDDMQQACAWYRAARQANLMEEEDKRLEGHCSVKSAIDATLLKSLEKGAHLRDEARDLVASCFPSG
ncbi:Sel1 repeat-containing protein [Tahibacter aquaticus]|uniref:Sel1 repeat-containing protein n=1 Tax=Tahibacter aquaticus TaxID=520092 RepID=A0A4R6Z061_9GAMM|nr:SEL1-like repeat protein [Tahibacter aquaticus]TDR44895.1 Sel1 repeat-containing protein [Tahibacter aquaticus]